MKMPKIMGIAQKRGSSYGYGKNFKRIRRRKQKVKKKLGFCKIDLENILSRMTPESLLRINSGNLIDVKFTTCETLEKLRKQNKELIDKCECLKAENTALKSTDSKIISEPIKAAENLIYAEYEYQKDPISKAFSGKQTGTARVYSKSELRQIAEHLLVYCNWAEE